MWSHFMSRWTAYLIAAAAVAGVFSLPPIAPAAAAPAAGAHARGPVAAPTFNSARSAHRVRPPAFALRLHARSGGHGARHHGRWQGHHGVSHGRFGRPDHRRYGHHARRNMLGYGAAGWGATYNVQAAPVYTGYAEPPLQWTHAEPDLAPCVRPLIIQIGSPAHNRAMPQVSYGAAGCGAPQVVRYVAGPRVLDVTSGEAPARGAALRARH